MTLSWCLWAIDSVKPRPPGNDHDFPLDRPTQTGVYTEKHRANHGEAGMYAEERLQFMVQRARLDGRVDVAVLAQELNVTAETIRRDLSSLERQGLLRRVPGG